MTPEQRQHYRDMLELTRGFMPHNPLEAYERVREVLAELEREAEPNVHDQELRALGETMLASYGRAASAWQAENVRRGLAMQARELAALRHGANLR